MANWSLPGLTDLYTNIITYFKGRDDDAVRLNDTRSASASNLPDNAKRWNATLGTFQNWLSSVWADMVIAVAGGGTGATTAEGARSNLGVPSVSEASAAAQGLVDTHNAVTNPHGAVSAPTASKLILRDSSGRAQVSEPSTGSDISTANYAATTSQNRVDTHANLTNPHSAVSAPTASRLVLRDSVGRAQVATPSAAADIATKGYVDGMAGSGGAYAASRWAIQNITTIGAVDAIYTRVANVVSVSLKVEITASATGVSVIFDVALPVASDFTGGTVECVGLAQGSWPENTGRVEPNTTDNRARITYYTDHATSIVNAMFLYLVK